MCGLSSWEIIENSESRLKPETDFMCDSQHIHFDTGSNCLDLSHIQFTAQPARRSKQFDILAEVIM